MIESDESGTLEIGEWHPAANSAMQYVRAMRANVLGWMQLKEAVASTALSGNRMSEILFSTMERIDHGRPVSDRYLLGLAWWLKGTAEAAGEVK